MTEFTEESYIDTLITFIRASQQITGVRRFCNPLLGLGPYDRHSHGIPPLYFDGDRLREEIEVDITLDHMKLLASMRACHWLPKERPAFDPKRVFNDHRDAVVGAYVAINGDTEIHDDGEIDLSKADERKYRRLYEETVAVLQVLVREAEVTPGIYLDSFFGGFKRLGDAEPYSRIKAIFTKRQETFPRAEYIEAITARSASRESYDD